MSISQFLRILWAYRLLVLATTLLAFAIGVTTVQVVKPQYQAESRVMLDVIKPDPVTGQVMATAFLRAFTKTQVELVKDPQTARQVVDKLGWAKDPAQLRSYQLATGGQGMDFNQWAAQQIVNGANAKLIEGSNILEISFKSQSPTQAKRVADTLRQAYIDLTLQSRRDAARRNAEWYEDQGEKARTVLFQAEQTKSNFERQTGIVLGSDKVDIETARLAALATQGGGPVFAPSANVSSPSALALAQLDAELTEASKSLGPNHPRLLEMQRRRQLLSAQAAQERDTSSAAAASTLSAARATQGMLEAQKQKVMSQREQVEKLRLMQDEIDLRRGQYNRAVARAAQLRQEAEVAESGVVPLASAVTPKSPIFPKKGLIIGGSIAAGAAAGVVIGMLIEIFGRRVRSTADLRSAISAPVLAVIRKESEGRSPLRAQLARLKMPSLKRPRVARA